LAAFAAAERLMRMALTILQAVPNVLQNWLGSAGSPVERRHRVIQAIALNTAVGVASGIGFTLLTPWFSTLLFTGTVQVEWQLAALASVVLALVCVSRATGPLALVRYGRVRAITASAVAAAAIGVPAICLLSSVAGAAGAMGGEILAEATAICVQVAALSAAIRRDQERSD
jgi:O-antigen/teichoic acid export membrane protein